MEGSGTHSSFMEGMKTELGLTAGKGDSEKGPASIGICYGPSVALPPTHMLKS